MNNTASSAAIKERLHKRSFKQKLREQLRQYMKHKYLLFMLAPVILWYAVFQYAPLYGIQLAFKNFRVMEGIWGSPWVGVKHFEFMFTASPNFPIIMRNTVIISLLHILFGFPAPIILALIFNELRSVIFKRVTQTISYLPHFLSWIVMGGMVIMLLSPTTGIVNYIIQLFGFDPIYFLADPSWFRPTLVISAIWKEIGWGTIIFLAALTSVDPDLYEASRIDGASRWKQTIYITLPSIMHVIAILFVLRMGGILNAGFDQILNLYNPAVYEVADIIDTYVYRIGISGMDYSFATAVGLFKNIIALALVLLTNYVVKRSGQEGLY